MGNFRGDGGGGGWDMGLVLGLGWWVLGGWEVGVEDHV